VSSPALDAREERWARRLSLARALPSGGSLLTLTLRLPAALRLGGAFDGAARELFRALEAEARQAGISILFSEFRAAADGPEGWLSLGIGAREAKDLALGVEKEHPWGALADIDVMDREGRAVGRADLGLPPRTCLVCGAPGAVCAAGAVHDPSELRAAAEAVLDRPVPERGEPAPLPRVSSACQIGRLALQALLEEAAVDPKPGLVTPSSRGSHVDMDYFTFLAGAAALAPWFPEAAALGAGLAGFASPEDPAARSLLESLRSAGRRAEAVMFEATGGVNTHKGLVFSLGALCAAAGCLIARGRDLTAETCCAEAGALALAAAGADFKSAASKPEAELTAGERLHRRSGVEGARGEAARGFPSALRVGLPRLRSHLAAGLSRNDALVETLLALCATVEDTCVLARGGPEGLEYLRTGAGRALALGGTRTEAGRDAVRALDDGLIARNLSPGGCADLLAVTGFLDRLG
jgi:holo-ACP synthase/triphosphoribosyl-dephospho-CoA synthase